MFNLLGIDCAVSPRNIGLARGHVENGVVTLHEVATSPDEPVEWLAQRLRDDVVNILALDAPLGWPISLAPALSGHQAGSPVRGEAHALFRRFTDDEIHLRLEKRPLDVGADRIARTAHATLLMLQKLREQTSFPIPAVTNFGCTENVLAIEVYPAATLSALGLVSRGYKGPKGRAVRGEIRAGLVQHIAIGGDVEVVDSDHALDAAICVLAAADFVLRKAPAAPADRADQCSREGWIWVREKSWGDGEEPGLNG